MSTSQPHEHYLKDYLPPPFIVEHIYLHIELKEKDTSVSSVIKIYRNPKSKDKKASCILNGENLNLQSVRVNGQLLSDDQYQVDSEHLIIADVPDQFTLETHVIIQPQENTKLSGLYQSRSNFCTQCEAHGFRRITYYFDRPDVMTRFTTSISADRKKYPMLLSNGNLIEIKELENGRHWVLWEDPSLKPSYLFAVVAGDFDLIESTFTTMSNSEVRLKLYLEKGYKDQGDHAMQSLKRAMHWDEKTWGREYDLEIYMIVAVSDFNMGAMENKGLNIFNTRYILAKPETAEDRDYVGIENVIGHEYFHNWSGNRVTCRDWFQITLKEGLTVFRDQQFIEDMTDASAARLNSVNIIRDRQFVEDSGPMAHPIRPQSYIEVNNFYTATVYTKGAEVIRMIQTLIGKELFRKGMDLYFKRHDGEAVTTEDFVKAMEDASAKDLTQFKRWYDQAGTPVLDVSSEYQREKQQYILTVRQSCPATPGQPEKKPFHLPLAMGLIDQDGEEIKTKLNQDKNEWTGTRILEIKEPEQQFIFLGIHQEPTPSLLRHFSAPVKIRFDYTDEQLAQLLKFDQDGFVRWDAGQKLATRIILRCVEQNLQKEPLTVPELILDTWKQCFDDKKAHPLFLAQLFCLPSVTYLLQQGEKLDVDAVVKARQFVKKYLAKQLEKEWLSIYEKNPSDENRIYEMAAMGHRKLRNVALNYLLATGESHYAQMAYQQFEASKNMTNVMGALNALNHAPVAERKKSLEQFYEKWQNAPLLVNKWLGLEASAALPETLNRVKELTKHSAYNTRNPNNIYALIGGFGANEACFHAKDGSGYEFIADQVLAIDPFNPQVAARVLQPLILWRQRDDHRGELMKTQLERIKSAGNLSNDIYELVNKSLV